MTHPLAHRPVVLALAVTTILLAGCRTSTGATSTSAEPVSTAALPTVPTTPATTAATTTAPAASTTTASTPVTPPLPTTVDAVVTTTPGGAPVTLPPFNDRNGKPLDPPPVVVPAGTIPLAPLPVTSVPNDNIRPMPTDWLPAVDVHLKFVTAYLEAISHFPVDTGRDRYAGLATDSAIDKTIAVITDQFASRNWYWDLSGGVTLRPNAYNEGTAVQHRIGDCWWQSLRIVHGPTGREIVAGDQPKYKAEGLDTVVTSTAGTWMVTDVDFSAGGGGCAGFST